MLVVVGASPGLALRICPVVGSVLLLAFFPLFLAFAFFLCGFFFVVVVVQRGCGRGWCRVVGCGGTLLLRRGDAPGFGCRCVLLFLGLGRILSGGVIHGRWCRGDRLPVLLPALAVFGQSF